MACQVNNASSSVADRLSQGFVSGVLLAHEELDAMRFCDLLDVIVLCLYQEGRVIYGQGTLARDHLFDQGKGIEKR